MAGGPFSREAGSGGWAKAEAMLKAGLAGPLGGTRAAVMGRGAAPLRAQLLQREGVERDGPLNTETRFRDPSGGDPQGKLLNACSVEPRPAGRWGSRWVAASRAAQVAATPAGVNRIRLATGTSGGTEAGAGIRASSARAVLRRVAWREGGGGEGQRGDLAASVAVVA